MSLFTKSQGIPRMPQSTMPQATMLQATGHNATGHLC